MGRSAAVGRLSSLGFNRRLIVSTAPDLRVLAFTFCVMLVTALLFGLCRRDKRRGRKWLSTLKEQAGSVLGGGNVALRKLLVAAQVTLSLSCLSEPACSCGR